MNRTNNVRFLFFGILFGIVTLCFIYWSSVIQGDLLKIFFGALGNKNNFIFIENMFKALRFLGIAQLLTLALSVFAFGLYFAERWRTKNS